jgi:hypothetical protein
VNPVSYRRHQGCLTMSLCRLFGLHPDDSCLPFGRHPRARCREQLTDAMAG